MTASSEGHPTDDEATLSIAVEPGTKCKAKGAMRINHSAPYEPTGVGKAPPQKCIAWRSKALDCSSHGVDSQPCRSDVLVWLTAQAERQQFERQKEEAEMLELGVILEEIKKARERNKFHQEDHMDDCGSDLGPLGKSSWVRLFGADGSFRAAIDYSYGEHQDFCDDFVESSEDDLEYIWSDNFALILASSDGTDAHQGSAQVPIEDLKWYLSQPKLSGRLDVVDIFGESAAWDTSVSDEGCAQGKTLISKHGLI